jgi:hypothetical protein
MELGCIQTSFAGSCFFFYDRHAQNRFQGGKLRMPNAQMPSCCDHRDCRHNHVNATLQKEVPSKDNSKN